MSRSHFRRCTALAACVLTASACGKGLFTGNPSVDASADRGIAADSSTDLPAIDTPILPAFDAYPDQRALPDVPADGVEPGSSIAESVDLEGKTLTLGVATLFVPRLAFAWPTDVTLTLVSDDGRLEDHPGAVGPIFSLSKTAPTDAQPGSATLQVPATLTLAFTPADPSIPPQRLTLAYLSTQSVPNLWIPIASPVPNPPPGRVAGRISEFSGTLLLAPVESCTGGQACPGLETCQSDVCQ